MRTINNQTTMKKLLLVLLLTISFVQMQGQKKQIWTKIADNFQDADKFKTTSYSANQQLYRIDLTVLRQALVNATDKFSNQPGIIVEFPNAEGVLEKFSVWENSNFSPELQQRYPDIRAYIGKGMTDRTAVINFSVSPLGLQTFVFRADNGSEFIEPYTKDRSVYVFFDSKTRTTARLPFNCGTVDKKLTEDLTNNPSVTNRSNNQSYKTMRLALSCTGEYGTYFGGTLVATMAAMNATMTRVNGVFEKDMALHLNLIPNNDLVVYTNASTDPYSPESGMSNWNDELQANLTSVIGEANYDIGHLFGATGGGGDAGCIGCVCGTGKGSGYTSPSGGGPVGDNFDIDYVIHEMGHQLGANHTFSHSTEGTGVNVEPGSGSTIMGYAGITNYDVQAHSDAYFTYRSIQQMQTNLAAKSCPAATPIINTPPSVSAGDDFTIPAGTPYTLNATVTDAEGDALTYCWEQNNSASSASSGANSVASATKVIGPTFRSFIPKSVPERSMPDKAKILAGTLNTTWESLSNVARSLKFTLTVRDNNIAGPQTNTDEVTITSLAAYNAATGVGAGPFVVTSQNTNTVAWAQGSTQTITWSVNNTTSLPGSQNVNIKLSIDGGLTFPYILAADIPNDGTEDIIVPDVPASETCRILVEPTANKYYAINTKAFHIGYELQNTCTTYTFATPFNLPDGVNSYTNKTINVPDTGTITDVNVTINATHPELHDLYIAMTRPGGSLSNLFNQQCTGSANMNVTFDAQGSTLTCGSPLTGTFIPPYNLNNFNGLNQQGNWQFGFKDLVAGNVGSINSIALDICSQSFRLLATTSPTFENFSLYPNPNNGAFTIRFHTASNNKISIGVFDLEGRKIMEKAYENQGDFNQDIELSAAQAGIYLVTITDGNAKMIKKISIR